MIFLVIGAFVGGAVIGGLVVILLGGGSGPIPYEVVDSEGRAVTVTGPFASQVETMQLFAQGLISRRTALKRLGIVEDVEAELKQIEAERIERL